MTRMCQNVLNSKQCKKSFPESPGLAKNGLYIELFEELLLARDIQKW